MSGASKIIYVGLDTFGRIAGQRWNDGSGTAMDRFQYAYDANSNPVARVNALSAANSEAYGYDALDRLTSFSRQTVTVSGSTTAPTVTTSGTASATQSWNYDSLGNWATMSFNGSTHSSTFNSQNQLTTNGPTSSTLAYDTDGNTTTDEDGNTLTYDAWNRMSGWREADGVVTNTYSYDGLGRRYGVAFTGAAVADPAPDRAWVLSLAGQVLTEAFARSGTETVEYDEVWSPVYVNAMVCRDEFDAESSIENALPGGGGGTDTVTEDDGSTFSQRLYARTDANYDVTSLVGSTDGTTWITVERDLYTPYGVRTVTSATWSGATTGSTVGFTQGFQGGFYDAGSGLMRFNASFLDPSIGRFEAPPASHHQLPVIRTNSASGVYIVPGVGSVSVNPKTIIEGDDVMKGEDTDHPYGTSITLSQSNKQCDCDFIQMMSISVTLANGQHPSTISTHLDDGTLVYYPLDTYIVDSQSLTDPTYVGGGGWGGDFPDGSYGMIDAPLFPQENFADGTILKVVQNFVTMLICDGSVKACICWRVTTTPGHRDWDWNDTGGSSLAPSESDCPVLPGPIIDTPAGQVQVIYPNPLR